MKRKIKTILIENLDSSYHNEITDFLIDELINCKPEEVYDILFSSLSIFAIIQLKNNTSSISNIYNIVKYDLK